MNFTYENQGTHSYLVYQAAADEMIDSMSFGMLTNNTIKGLAKLTYTQMDNIRSFKYDVSSKIPVKQFFQGQVNKKRLVSVFSGIVDALLIAPDYFIDVNTILLDLDYIFVDVSTFETALISLPFISEDPADKDLCAFFKNIMFSTQFDQNEDCVYVAQIINKLNSTSLFSLADFKSCLDAISGAPAADQGRQQERKPVEAPPVVAPVISENTQQSTSGPSSEPQVKRDIREQPVAPSKREQVGDVIFPEQPSTVAGVSLLTLLSHPSKENLNLYKQQRAAEKAEHSQSTEGKKQQKKKFGFAIPGHEEPVQKEPEQQQKTQQQPAVSSSAPEARQTPESTNQVPSYGTVPLTPFVSYGTIDLQSLAKPHLIRERNNEQILIDKPLFSIGGPESCCDYEVSDNRAVSHAHAAIISRDGAFYIKDTNSKNHTYVNGSMIPANVEVKLTDGAKIILANEKFEFRVQLMPTSGR